MQKNWQKKNRLTGSPPKPITTIKRILKQKMDTLAAGSTSSLSSSNIVRSKCMRMKTALNIYDIYQYMIYKRSGSTSRKMCGRGWTEMRAATRRHPRLRSTSVFCRCPIWYFYFDFSDLLYFHRTQVRSLSAFVINYSDWLTDATKYISYLWMMPTATKVRPLPTLCH